MSAAVHFSSDLLIQFKDRLDQFLVMSDEDIRQEYQNYRKLLKEVYEAIPEHSFGLPLFPERVSAEILKAKIDFLMNQEIEAVSASKSHPLSKKKTEQWIKSTATILKIQIRGNRSVLIEYEYVDDKGQKNHGTYDFEQDHMHRSTWFWDEKEVLATFSPGTEHACWVSSQNHYRHRISLVFENWI